MFVALLPAALNIVLQARGKGIKVRPETVLIVFYIVATASLVILTLDPILILTPTEQPQIVETMSIIAFAAIATAYTVIYPPQGDGSTGLWAAVYLVVLVVLSITLTVVDLLPYAEEAIRSVVVLLSLAYFYAYPYFLADLACKVEWINQTFPINNY